MPRIGKDSNNIFVSLPMMVKNPMTYVSPMIHKICYEFVCGWEKGKQYNCVYKREMYEQ